jgi:hypothetical protein
MGFSVFATASRSALIPTQPPILWVPGTLTPWVKLPAREGDHSLPSSAEVRMLGDIPPLPNTSSLRGALVKRVQNGSGAHPASYPMGTRGSFARGKVAGA